MTDQPWSGYNWYDGGRRSRVDINTDLPVRATDLIHVVAHETYPGHHLEHAWKEADLVDTPGPDGSARSCLINTPECLISEGLADVGAGSRAPEAELVDLLVELYGAAGPPIAGTRPRPATPPSDRSPSSAPRRPSSRSAAMPPSCAMPMDGRTRRSSTTSWTSGRTRRAVSEKRLEFIEHPLWRTYVFVYAEGEALLRRWLDQAPEPAPGRPVRPPPARAAHARAVLAESAAV